MTVTVPGNAATGTYDVLLAAPDAFAKNRDDVRFAVRFANAYRVSAGQQWKASDATFSTGTSLKVVNPTLQRPRPDQRAD